MSEPAGQRAHHRAPHRAAVRRWGPAVAWSLFWLVVAGLVVVPYLQAYEPLSPFDEMVHVDYLDKAGRFELVSAGEKVDEASMRAQACRGHEIAALEFPPCDASDMKPEQFQEFGFNTAYGDPPTYYYATAWIAFALDAVPGVDDLVSRGRAVGVLWLGAGLAVTFLLARRLGASRLAALGAGLVVAASPTVAHASATITTDAPAILLGAVLCVVALGVVRRDLSWWWLVPAAAAATAVKVSTLTVVGAVVVFLLLHLVGSDRVRRVELNPTNQPEHAEQPEQPEQPQGGASSTVSPREVLLAVGATVAGALVPLLAWLGYGSATALPAADDIPMHQTFRVSSIGWEHISGSFLSLITPLRDGFIPAFIEPGNLILFMVTVQVVLIAAVLGLSWFGDYTAKATKFAIAAVASMFLSGPVLVVLVFVASHTYTAIPPRYGLSLVAPAAACLAVAASRRRSGAIGLAVLGGAGMFALLAQTL